MSPAHSEEAAVTLERIDALETRVAALSNAFTILGVEKASGICGGSARIVRTRIPIWTLKAFRRKGASESQILEAYPALNAADLVAAWAYASSHSGEIDADIERNKMDAEE